MHIGVDIDNTIANTTESTVRWYNLTLGKNINPAQIRTYFLTEEYGLDHDQEKQLWRRLEHAIYGSCLPKKEAASILTSLAGQGHRITFITARPSTSVIHRITRRWLEHHAFPFTGDNLVLGAFNKAKEAKQLGCELFFDDFPHHVQTLMRAHVPTIVVNAPYNGDVEATGRLFAWREAPGLVEEVMRIHGTQISLFDVLADRTDPKASSC